LELIITFKIFLIFLVSFFSSWFFLPTLIKKLLENNIFGIDVHKSNKPQIPEMGGIAFVFSFLVAILFSILLNIFFGFNFDTIKILAVSFSVLLVAIIGAYDDLFGLRQLFKAILPLFAAIPLFIFKFYDSGAIFFPLLGPIDFGILYLIILVPLGIAVPANLTNMLAGFNGLETGLGIIIFSTLLVISFLISNVEVALISAAMLGGLIAFFYYNFYPAKVFPGDVGTLSIGAALGCASIIGKIEFLGALIVVPFVIDFFIKAFNKFPKSFAILENNNLHPPKNKIRSLSDLLLKLFGGLSEKNLVFIIFLIEIIFCLLAIFLVIFKLCCL
jgi:UDP-N-acetylglucosamine--dolichyl-phosphate N-acetylglucosaminephosphotransferase